MAQVYKTEGIILKKRDFGEADRVFSFFTKDYGRIEAAAQGVRHLKSKLRYSLSGLSVLRLGFVATGGDNWRLVDSEETEVFSGIMTAPQKFRMSQKMLIFLERFVRGQEPDGRLWEILKEFFLFLEKNDLPEKELKNFELLTVCRFLKQLGYLEDTEELDTASLAAAAEKAIAASHL